MLPNQRFPVLVQSIRKTLGKRPHAFEWQRGTCHVLAMHGCTSCHGAGTKFPRKSGDPEIIPCNCVLRAIFRTCWNFYMIKTTQERHLSRASIAHGSRRSGRPGAWGRLDEEYIADFELVAERALTAAEWHLLKLHYMGGADWTICTRKLGLTRGNFFHELYRLEQKLGRVYAELQPYGLFPVDEYFHGQSKLTGPRDNPRQVFYRPAVIHDETLAAPPCEASEPAPVATYSTSFMQASGAGF